MKVIAVLLCMAITLISYLISYWVSNEFTAHKKQEEQKEVEKIAKFLTDLERQDDEFTRQIAAYQLAKEKNLFALSKMIAIYKENKDESAFVQGALAFAIAETIAANETVVRKAAPEKAGEFLESGNNYREKQISPYLFATLILGMIVEEHLNDVPLETLKNPKLLPPEKKLLLFENMKKLEKLGLSEKEIRYIFSSIVESLRSTMINP